MPTPLLRSLGSSIQTITEPFTSGITTAARVIPKMRFRHPHLDPTLLARYDSSAIPGVGGVSVRTDDPEDESTAEILRDVITFRLTFEYGAEVEHFIAVIAMLVGLSLVFLGVRLFKPLLFGVTWILVGGIVYFISMLISHGNSLSSFLAGLFIGVVFAVAVVKTWKFSLFVAGALFGLVAWILFQTLFPMVLATPAAMYTVLTLSILGFGILGTRMEKIALLFATPILGAFTFLQGVDHFAHAGLNAFVLLTEEGQHMCESNGKCFGLYALLLVIAAAGIFVQWKYTADLSPQRDEKSKEKKKVAPAEMSIFQSPKKSGKKNGPSKLPVQDRSGFGNPFASRRALYPNPSVESEYFEG